MAVTVDQSVAHGVTDALIARWIEPIWCNCPDLKSLGVTSLPWCLPGVPRKLVSAMEAAYQPMERIRKLEERKKAGGRAFASGDFQGAAELRRRLYLATKLYGLEVCERYKDRWSHNVGWEYHMEAFQLAFRVRLDLGRNLYEMAKSAHGPQLAIYSQHLKYYLKCTFRYVGWEAVDGGNIEGPHGDWFPDNEDRAELDYLAACIHFSLWDKFKRIDDLRRAARHISKAFHLHSHGYLDYDGLDDLVVHQGHLDPQYLIANKFAKISRASQHDADLREVMSRSWVYDHQTRRFLDDPDDVRDEQNIHWG